MGGAKSAHRGRRIMDNSTKRNKLTIGLIIGIIVLAYLILPFDIIPDIALGAGQIDDGIVAILGIALEVFNFLYTGNIDKKTEKDDSKGKEAEDAQYREV